jgi:glutaconate CoA-transferase subunit B
MTSYSPTEMMTIVAARRLHNEDICFVGIGAPSAACNLARLTHAPDITLIYESGTIRTRPTRLPLSIGDGELCETALTTCSVPEMFRYWLQGGRIKLGFLGAAQIDRFANLNTTVIGEYDAPQTRLPGGGGAPEIAAHCQETVVIMKQSKRAFVDKVDFRTTYGFGAGGGERARLGLRTRGPAAVITDLCVMTPETGSDELLVASIFPGVSRDDVSSACGWPIQYYPELYETPRPTDEELRVLRALQAASAT